MRLELCYCRIPFLSYICTQINNFYLNHYYKPQNPKQTIMKRIFKIAICLALVLPMLNSCKKGENDPMSLKSRKARLAGEWELTEWSRTQMSGSTISTTTFSGSSKMVMSGSSTSTTTYSEKLEIAKDGTYTFATSEMDTSFTYSLTGTGAWYWLKGNKELEYKSKERIGFEELSSTRF